jgi:hypothetical protein
MNSDLGRRTTTLTGRVADQAALHGLLARIRDQGLTMIAAVLIIEKTGGDG